MATHARVEELSDSDSDPDEMDLSQSNAASLAGPGNAPAGIQKRPLRSPSAEDSAKIRRWQCIYPIYFDKTRSKAQGRRVGLELAVENPLARTIYDAVEMLGLEAVLEAGKFHPQDWSNPGRIKVLLKADGQLQSPLVKNKRHLYILTSKYLKTHPTTESTPLRLRIIGMPVAENPIVNPATPRGWKMPSILPLHSPALSGGGVSENLLKDMMRDMQAQQGQLDPGSGSESRKKKKDKKKSRT